MTTKELFRKARMASAKAYAPYSHFKIGAALETANNKIFMGCNIENASYGLTLCAERVALYKAISEGERRFKTLVIWTNTKDFTYPCGACRQVIYEFAPEIKIIVANNKNKYKIFKVKDLLPKAFSLYAHRQTRNL